MMIMTSNFLWVSVAVVSAMFVESTQGQQPGNILFTIPTELVSSALLLVEPMINKEINQLALPQCCYDDVGVKHVHLDFQQLNLSNTNVSLALSATAQSLQFKMGFDVTLSGYYRLCVHDDPFSHKACSAVEGCKGNFYLQPNVLLDASMGLGATPTGGLALKVFEPSFQIVSLKSNMCSLFISNIDKEETKISTAVEAALFKALQSFAANVSTILPKPFDTKLFDGVVRVSNGTQTSSGAVVIEALAVIMANNTKVTGPWAQLIPLPTTVANPDHIYLRVGESLVSNVLWALAKDISAIDFVKNQSGAPPVHCSLSAAPMLWHAHVNATDQRAELGFNFKGVTGDNVSVFNATVLAHVGLEFNLTKNTTATPPTFDLNIQLTQSSGIDVLEGNCTGACISMVNKVKTLLQFAVPPINKLLSTKFIHIPATGLKSAVLSFGPAFMQIDVLPDMTALLSHMLNDGEPLVAPHAIKCPVIPKAHPDGCI
eukprot:m.173333 g.173333  ORF g.173333 m.173333 type:complete len:487 (-) comp31724_c2_seq1:57-1517(-)